MDCDKGTVVVNYIAKTEIPSKCFSIISRQNKNVLEKEKVFQLRFYLVSSHEELE